MHTIIQVLLLSGVHEKTPGCFFMDSCYFLCTIIAWYISFLSLPRKQIISLCMMTNYIQWISLNWIPVNRTSRLLLPCHNLVPRLWQGSNNLKVRLTGVWLSEIHCNTRVQTPTYIIILVPWPRGPLIMSCDWNVPRERERGKRYGQERQKFYQNLSPVTAQYAHVPEKIFRN